MTPAEPRTSLDAVCVAAADMAREAAVTVGRQHVGEHVGVEEDGERVVTHLFACTDPAYAGWRWGVQVARASRAKTVTVNDVVLLPGPKSLLAPVWLPWSERLLPGDLRPGDLLPAPPDDERLQLVIEDTDADDGFIEMGVGRMRVLSDIGRTEAAERWYGGDRGPDALIARQAPAHCVSCGFFVPVTGALGLAFGICANEYAPDDGRVVSADHGCGAHSEGFPTVIDLIPREVPADADDMVVEMDDVAEPSDAVLAGAVLPDAELTDAELADAEPADAGPPDIRDESSVTEALAEDSEETAAFGHS